MRLLIDAQSIQTVSRDRGIGRYALSLIRAMVNHSRGHEVHAILNAQCPSYDLAKARSTLTTFMVPERVHVFQSDSDTAGPLGDQMRLAAQASYCASITSVNPDVVLVTSPFEDDRFTVLTVNHDHELPPMAGILYDLIPAMSPDLYSPDKSYWRRFREVSRFNILLAISQYSANQAHSAYGSLCPPVIPIWGGPHESDHDSPVVATQSMLAKSFVLYVGGDHPRKNLDGAIRAWALVSPAVRATHTLVIACHLSAGSRESMQALRDDLGMTGQDVVFTGWINDAHLAHLYSTARLFIFPSLEEGLGMPPLEAMSHGCPTLVADNSSLVELVERDEALFDGSAPQSIAEAIDRALGSCDLLRTLAEDARSLSRRFTWSSVAERAWDALEGLVPQHPKATAMPLLGRVGVLSPLPPAASGVADYTARLAPALESLSDDLVLREDSLVGVSPLDVRILHLGNSPWHVPIAKEGRHHGGYAFVHDTHVGQTYQHLLVNTSSDVELAMSLADQANLKFPARVPPGLRWSLENSDGVLFHSRHAARLSFEAGCVNVPMAVVPFPCRPAVGDRASARSALGIGAEDLVVAHFGIISSAKGILPLIQALQRCRPVLGSVVLALVGYAPDSEYLGRVHSAAQRAGIPIRVTANASSERWSQWMCATDIAVQLRTVDHGETSAAVAELLATGVPLVVSDQGSAREIDASVALRVRHPLDGDDLASAIESLTDPAVREAMSAAQVHFVEQNSTEHRWAEAVAHYISKWQAQARFRQRIRDVVGDDLHKWPHPTGSLTRPFAGWMGILGAGVDYEAVRTLLDGANCALYLPDRLVSAEVSGCDLVILDDAQTKKNLEMLAFALAVGRSVAQVGSGPPLEPLVGKPGFRFFPGDLTELSSWHDLLEVYASPPILKEE